MPYIIFGFLTLVFGLLFLIIIKSSSLLPIEKGLTPAFKIRCSAIIGQTHYQGPFITLRVYNDFIVISALKKIVLKFNEINKVEITKKWQRNVTQIHHNKTEFSQNIILFFVNNNLINFIMRR